MAGLDKAFRWAVVSLGSRNPPETPETSSVAVECAGVAEPTFTPCENRGVNITEKRNKM